LDSNCNTAYDKDMKVLWDDTLKYVH
jgi:hypothetical protein